MPVKPKPTHSDIKPDFRGFMSESMHTKTWSSSLISYLDQLWEANRGMNLFSRTMHAQRLWTEHVCDCLAGLPFFNQPRDIVDLGSGGGLPGVILAIAIPHTNVWLYEKSPKKNMFLSQIAEQVPNLKVMGPLEKVNWPSKAIVTCRAFKPIKQIVSLTHDHLMAGGSYCLYKGRKAKIEQELAECSVLKKIKVNILPIEVPFEAERHMVVFQG